MADDVDDASPDVAEVTSRRPTALGRRSPPGSSPGPAPSRAVTRLPTASEGCARSGRYEGLGRSTLPVSGLQQTRGLARGPRGSGWSWAISAQAKRCSSSASARVSRASRAAARVVESWAKLRSLRNATRPRARREPGQPAMISERTSGSTAPSPWSATQDPSGSSSNCPTSVSRASSGSSDSFSSSQRSRQRRIGSEQPRPFEDRQRLPRPLRGQARLVLDRLGQLLEESGSRISLHQPEDRLPVLAPEQPEPARTASRSRSAGNRSTILESWASLASSPSTEPGGSRSASSIPSGSREARRPARSNPYPLL